MVFAGSNAGSTAGMGTTAGIGTTAGMGKGFAGVKTAGTSSWLYCRNVRSPAALFSIHSIMRAYRSYLCQEKL